MLQLDSSSNGRSVDHVSTYSGRQIAIGSQNHSRITRQKTCCASESNTSVRVVLANRSGFDTPIGVVSAWEERGSCLKIFRMTNLVGVVLAWEERGSWLNILRTTNRGRISESFTNYEAKDLLRNRHSMGGAWIMSYNIPEDKSQSDLRNLHELQGKRLVAQASQTHRFALYFGTRVVFMLQLESSWHGRSVDHVLIYSGRQIASSRHGRNVDHVLTYSGRQIVVGSQKPSRITRQKTCCAIVLAWEERGSCLNIFRMTNRGRILETFTIYEAKDLLRNESNTSVRVVFANRSGFDAPIAVVMAWEEHGSCLNIFRMTNRGRISETFTNYEAKDLLRKSMDHVLTYSGGQIAVGSQKTLMNYKAKDLLRKRVKHIGRQIAVGSQKASRIVVVLMLQLQSSWHERSVDHVLTYSGRQIASSWHRRSVDHVLTYSGRQIAVGSQNPSRITRQMTCCASESNTSVRVVFANQSGFDAPIGVVLAREERGSCLNIFRTTNHGQILETFTNNEAKELLCMRVKHLESSWHGRSLDHVLTYYGRQITVGSQKASRITRQKTCCANESNTSARVVFANRSGFHAPIAVVMAWEGANLHELQGKRLVAQASQTHRFALNFGTGVVFMLQFESSWHGRSVDHVLTYSGRQIASSWHERSVDHVLTYSGRQIASSWHGRSVDHVLTYSGRQITVGSQKPSRINESNTLVRVVFANRGGFDDPIAVVMAWEERGSCLNIFQMTNHGRISESFLNYKANDLLRKSVDHVLTYSERQITVRSQKPSRITRQKTRCASESNTSVRVVFENRSGFDAPIGVVMAWEERVTRQKTCCASASNTSVRVVFANRSGFDAPIAVVMAWEERGSCLNIFQMKNRCRILETFTNYEAKDLLRKSVDHVLTYSERQIAVGSQKPSRITRQKTCCASEPNRSVRVVFANRSGFDAPVAVVLAWEERGSCLNIFWMTNRGRISETFMNYDLKDLLYNESNTSVRVVLANRSGFDAPIGVVLAWEERGSCLNIFRTTNHGRISENFTNYEGKDLLRKSVDHVLTYSGRRIVVGYQKASRITTQKTCYARRQIAIGSQKPSRIMRQKTCCASESNTSVRVVFANRTGFDAPIGVVLAWEERGSCPKLFRMTNRVVMARADRGSCLNIYRTTNNVDMAWEEGGSCINILRMTNRGWISETFTNYDAKDLLRKNLHELRGKRLVAHVSQTRRFTLYLRTGVVLMLQLLSSWHGRSVDHVLTYSGRKIGVGSQKTSRITSGFDAPIVVVLAWEDHGSCLNIFQMKNHGRISETFMHYEAKDLLRKSVDHVLTYSGRKIAVGSQKPSRITRQKICCASESNTSGCVVFANRSGFDAPIGVVLAWEERGSYTSVRDVFANQSGFDAPIGVVLACEERGSSLNIFQMTNHGRISETFTNYEAKDLLRESKTSVRVVFANRSGFDAPIGVVLAWEERGSCLIIFQMTNRDRISETFTNYVGKDLLRK
ncbi:uncharacterized protein G2W53_041920 [Senna tora]|uniref:Uncharacterized protein n=1 Tax=Senna tora TaxID=362788 RepID=A0A834SFY8_9FABA|nr:uncharacterized protein G2W53_041920 [Senna tora]